MSSASAVRARRSRATHASMFLRMLWRGAFLRRGRAAAALFAMVVAAAAATAMLNLYTDVQSKLRQEFRGYGANVLAVAKDGQSLPEDALQSVNSMLAGRGIAVPFAYVVARTAAGRSVVVAGTDFASVKTLDKWWSVTGWPAGPHEALVGVRAAPVVGPQDGGFDLSFQGRTIHLTASGTLRTGADEDSRIYISLGDFKSWTGLQPSTIEIASNGSPAEVNAFIQNLQHTLPAVEITPVRQVVESEARVLGKTRSMLLAAAILIIVTSALCVLSTLMGLVFDRRRDFAIMKSLGASQNLVGTFFAAEAGALCLAGGLLGFMAGVGIAAWIGQANFHATIAPRFSILPPVLAGSLIVGLLSAIFPIFLLRRIEPATILRGE